MRYDRRIATMATTKSAMRATAMSNPGIPSDAVVGVVAVSLDSRVGVAEAVLVDAGVGVFEVVVVSVDVGDSVDVAVVSVVCSAELSVVCSPEPAVLIAKTE